jgi:predicted RNA-binding Zn ribbon-like protein
METPEHIAAQRIVGGSLALDLLNTQNGPAGGTPEDDALHDYADVVAWGAYVGMLTPDEAKRLIRRSRRHPAAALAAYERVLETRGYLYELFRAIATGRNPPPTAIARLQRDEAEALAHGTLVREGDVYAWRWADDDLGRPLWPVIHEGLRLLTDGDLDRVKGCARCRFHFLDLSKNRSRRWCSMDDCGTADKMEKFVARRASARSAIART